jgi:hypothetical protein
LNRELKKKKIDIAKSQLSSESEEETTVQMEPKTNITNYQKVRCMECTNSYTRSLLNTSLCAKKTNNIAIYANSASL